jgi:hypothetical protein
MQETIMKQAASRAPEGSTQTKHKQSIELETFGHHSSKEDTIWEIKCRLKDNIETDLEKTWVRVCELS